jgi:eukaryotic-like serine/threonine-protein kinase
LWAYRANNSVRSSPAIAGSRVFVGGDDGVVRALDFAAGREVWRYEAGPPVTSSPAIGRGRLVIGDSGGTAYCFGP